jgi:hypothetical protein
MLYVVTSGRRSGTLYCGLAGAMGAAVEHDEDGRPLAAFGVRLATVGSRMRTRGKVTVVHGSSLDRSSDVFGTAYNSQSLLQIRKTGGGDSFEVRDRP